VHRLPLVPVNHLEGHIYATFLTDDPPDASVPGARVSGGHTALYHARAPLEYALVGQTRRRRGRRGIRQGREAPRARLSGGPVIERVSAGRRSQGGHVSAGADERRRAGLLVQRLKTSVSLYVKRRAPLGRAGNRDVAGVRSRGGREDARAQTL